MNPLVERLPEAVEIDGKEYAINYDHRTIIHMLTIFESHELLSTEKWGLALEAFYPKIPENIERAAELLAKFIDRGEEKNLEESDEEKEPQYRLYSFAKDATYIISAIKQTHGVDLEKETLHWWKFLWLFMDLSEQCFFTHLVSLRKRKKTGKLTDEERAQCYAIKGILDLDEEEPEEDEATKEFMRLFNG